VLIDALNKLTNRHYKSYSVRILQLFSDKALNEFYNKTEIFSTQSKCSHNFRLFLAKENFHFHLFLHIRSEVNKQRLFTLTSWYWSFTFNSNKSPTWCKNFSAYYPDVCLQLNMFRPFSRPSSGAQWLQWQPLVLPSYRGDRRAVFAVGKVGRPGHEHSTTVTTIRR
jgi:hypothetical protein